jgi:hypothetical protein
MEDVWLATAQRAKPTPRSRIDNPTALHGALPRAHFAKEQAMPENVTLNSGTNWTPAAVKKLAELWAAGTPADTIAAALGRSPSEVGQKAVELKLPRKH